MLSCPITTNSEIVSTCGFTAASSKASPKDQHQEERNFNGIMYGKSYCNVRRIWAYEISFLDLTYVTLLTLAQARLSPCSEVAQAGSPLLTLTWN